MRQLDNAVWDAELIGQLRQLHAEGPSFGIIAQRMGMTMRRPSAAPAGAAACLRVVAVKLAA